MKNRSVAPLANDSSNSMLGSLVDISPDRKKKIDLRRRHLSVAETPRAKDTIDP